MDKNSKKHFCRTQYTVHWFLRCCSLFQLGQHCSLQSAKQPRNSTWTVCIAELKKEDNLWVHKSEKDLFEASKSERQKKASARRSLKEAFRDAEEGGPSYEAGSF